MGCCQFTLSFVSLLCTDVCEVSPDHQSVYICIYTAEQQVCHSCCMCWFLMCFFFHSANEGFAMKRTDWKSLSLPLSFSPPGTFSSQYLPPFLLVSHLSSQFAPLLSPSSSDFPSDLPLSLSQRADFQPGNCMSTGHHTCCCQCSGVGERGELCPLASMAITPSPPPFAAGVNPQGGGSLIWRVCTCVV